MPLVDNDQINVIKATRTGTTNLEVEVEWIDGITLENKGRMSVSFGTVAEMVEFIFSQGFDDVLRPILLQTINRNTGQLIANGTTYDAMPGKSYKILSRVQAI